MSASRVSLFGARVGPFWWPANSCLLVSRNTTQEAPFGANKKSVPEWQHGPFWRPTNSLFDFFSRQKKQLRKKVGAILDRLFGHHGDFLSLRILGPPPDWILRPGRSFSHFALDGGEKLRAQRMGTPKKRPRKPHFGVVVSVGGWFLS